jgi:hypothetical protein
MPSDKRKDLGSQQQLTSIKKPRSDENNSIVKSSSEKQLFKVIRRTSYLSQPIMHLTGHSGGVLTCQFGPSQKEVGKQLIASAGTDGAICKALFFLFTLVLWNAWDDVEIWGMFRQDGKKDGSILQLLWSRDATYVPTMRFHSSHVRYTNILLVKFTRARLILLYQFGIWNWVIDPGVYGDISRSSILFQPLKGAKR